MRTPRLGVLCSLCTRCLRGWLVWCVANFALNCKCLAPASRSRRRSPLCTIQLVSRSSSLVAACLQCRHCGLCCLELWRRCCCRPSRCMLVFSFLRGTLGRRFPFSCRGQRALGSFASRHTTARPRRGSWIVSGIGCYCSSTSDCFCGFLGLGGAVAVRLCYGIATGACP